MEEPAQLYYNIYTTVDATCIGSGFIPTSGSCDGQIMVNVTGGTWPYFYDNTQANVWPIPSANQVQLINDTLIDSLCSGIYNIYLTDANGCDGQVSVGGVGFATIGDGIANNCTNCKYYSN